MTIGQVDAMKQIAHDASGTIFSRGVATRVSPCYEQSSRQRGLSHGALSSQMFDAPKTTLLTLSSLWTQRTRPQGTWKTAKNAVFHSANSDHLFSEEEKNEERKDKNTSTQLSTKSDQVQVRRLSGGLP